MTRATELSDAEVLRRMGVPVSVLRELDSTLSDHYRERLITERGKSRLLSVPSRRLRRVQRRITRNLLSRLPVHAAAFCHRGRGAIEAARLHVRHPWLLQLDLADFFPNTSEELVRRTFRDLGMSRPMSGLLSRVVCFEGRLPQGAPSSVAVSNLVMRHLDERIATFCRKQALTYTRYVDDVAVSGGSRVQWAERVVRKIITDEDWRLNDKGGLFRPDERRTYLGIILNSHPNLAADYVRDLAAVIRRLGQAGEPVSKDILETLLGRIGYVAGVHPKKGARLRDLYDLTTHLLKASRAASSCSSFR
jgi:hypothetical protein